MPISLADLLYPNVGGISKDLMAPTPEADKVPSFFDTKKKSPVDLTTHVEINGTKTEVPLLVPTLNKKEVDHLKELDPNDKDAVSKIPQSIIDKATEHAKKRIDDKKSQFFIPGDPRASTLLTESSAV